METVIPLNRQTTKPFNMKTLSTLIVACLIYFTSFGQEQQYKVAAIGFYNFENLFDTLDTPDKFDTEFTPSGNNKYNTAVYQEKLGNLSKVVSELGTELSPDGVALLGVAEIENRQVLEDFVKQPAIKDRNYGIIHYESPDFRGIDVALLYQPKYFSPTSSKAVPLLIYNDDGSPRVTRDILLVSGNFDGEPMHILVNHWPSRRGGESATQPYRNAGAKICKEIADSLTQENPYAKIILMGDLNDDPTSPSVKKVLQAQRYTNKTPKKGFFNPMYELFKRGFGSNAYRDAWSLFDQIIVSQGLLSKKAGGYRYHKAFVHNENYLIQKNGRYKGYPYRTFSFGNYIGGYSDHLPVYVYLLKPL